MEAAIKSLKANSAPGPDGMTSELLSKCACVITEPLASLFSKSLNIKHQCHHFSSGRQWYLSTKVGTGLTLVTIMHNARDI